MSFQITAQQMSSFCPRLASASLEPMVTAINSTMARFQIDQQPRRVRYFMAQAAFESQYFTKLSENLTYTTPERLVAVWPSRFTMTPPPALAAGSPVAVNARAYAPDYVNNPQKLANLVYANRGGNGDPQSGDGFRFRGRGLFGLTFQSNYSQYSNSVYGDQRIVMQPDLVAAPTDGCLSAGWFWSINSFNASADADQFTHVTTVINGSAATVPDRLAVLNVANSIFTW
jgi:putative chitinase